MPPLLKPEWLLSEFDRFQLLLTSFPFLYFFTEAFIAGIGNGDSWNGFWYNNAQAAGSQLYPAGLSKYFDLYSFTGITNYIIYYIWASTCAIFTPFTLIPANFWLGLLNGMSLDGIWKVIVPAPIAWFLHIRGENGWVLA